MKLLTWIFPLFVGAVFATKVHAQTFRPILPMQTSANKLPLLDTALSDPALKRGAIQDAISADSSKQIISEAEGDIKRSKGPRRIELAQTIYRESARLATYYAEILSGGITADGQKITSKTLSQTRQKIVRYAAIAAGTKHAAKKAQALYHLNLNGYFLGVHIKSIAKLRKVTNLTPSLQRRADLLVALHDLDRGDANSAKAKLRALIKPLPLEAAIVARLALARKQAGLNSRGVKLRKAPSGYRKYLAAATQRGRRLSKHKRIAILSYSMAVWRRAEGRRATWLRPPLALGGYRSLAQAHALSERIALEYASKAKYSYAVNRYSVLSKAYSGQERMISLDQRIIDIRRLEAKRSKKSRRYERALLAMKSQYATNDLLEAGSQKRAQSMRRFIEQRHQQLVDTQLRAARSKRASRTERSQAISLTKRYVDSIEDSTKRERYTVAIAQVYAIDNRHSQAVAIYQDLALNGDPKKKSSYLLAAIRSQRVLAKWPASAPWDGATRGPTNQRRKLRDFYQQQIESSKHRSWDDLAHVGLLNIQLGESGKAYQAWHAGIEAAPGNKHARSAAGYMIARFERQKRWSELEKISRLSLAKGVSPRYRGKTRSAKAALGIALLSGGKQLLAEKKPDEAKAKLLEFTKKYRTHKQHDDGLYHLALSQRATGETNSGLESLKTLVKVHPRSSFMKNTLRLGAQWAMETALEEDTIFFAQRYVDRYPREKKTVAMRSDLIALYQGRGLYDAASATMKAQTSSRWVGLDQRREVALELMAMEERYGSPKRAADTAHFLLKLAKKDAELSGHAYQYLSKYHHDRNEVKELRRIEAILLRMSDSISAQEALGQTRFFLAQRITTFKDKEIYNLTLKDPKATLEAEYKKYLTLKNGYRKVCATGTSSFCAPAQFAIGEEAGYLITIFEDITIVESLDSKTVKNFNDRKQDLVDKLGTDAQRYDEAAYATVQEGNTSPNWTQKILWENSADWNFDRITGETGNGYIQFSPDTLQTSVE